MPRWSDVIELISETYIENSMGDSIPIESYTQVFVSKKRVWGNEFYQAQANGLKPSLVFEMHSAEYHDQKKLRYEGKTYNIIRPNGNGEFVELICEGVVNSGNA